MMTLRDGPQQQVQMMGNKDLAELGTPASEHPNTRSHPTGIQRSQLLFWLGIAAGALLLAVLPWSFLAVR